MGLSPSALVDYRAPCGGSKPPPYEPAPYGLALVHPLYWLIELIAVGVNPHRTNPHRTDGPWSIRFTGLLDSYRWEQAPTVRTPDIRMSSRAREAGY